MATEEHEDIVSHPAGPERAPCHVDCATVWKIALRAPSLGDPGSPRPATFISRLDSLPENVSVNRPVVLGAALAEVAKVDGGCARLIVEGGLALQIRAEIEDRRADGRKPATPLVVRLKTAETPSNV